MIVSRRGFLAGVAGILAAPAIVRASSIMPVSSVTDVYRGARVYRVGMDGVSFCETDLVAVLRGSSLTPDEIRHWLANTLFDIPKRRPYVPILNDAALAS